MIAEYEKSLDEIAAELSADNHEVAVELAALPETVRGFGPVKAEAMNNASIRRRELLAVLRKPLRARKQAA